MKPPPFEYHAPRTVEDALGLLGTGTKVLAGGQSLVPLLNMRLTAPERLVDVTRIPELQRLHVSDDEGVRVGAAVRHRTVERDDRVARACPLLRQALALVAHEVIRNRGTVVGSLAHADPAGELTAVLALTAGRVELASSDGDGGRVVRTVHAANLFLGPLEADVGPQELVTAAVFGRIPPTAGTAFVEQARRHGDYAVCGIAATVDAGDDGIITEARVATISVHPTPLVLDVADVAGGLSLSAAREATRWADAGDRLASACEPEDDLHATADYRRHLARVLTGRALAAAAAHAQERRSAEAAA